MSTALAHLRSRCATAELCVLDATNYLRKHPELTADECDAIIATLLREHYIDEGRYARAFVSDKLRFNRWGRQRLQQELKMKGIDDTLIRDALAAIDDDDYRQALRQLIAAKRRTLKGADDRTARMKMIRHAASHGFELPLILTLLEEEEP